MQKYKWKNINKWEQLKLDCPKLYAEDMYFEVPEDWFEDIKELSFQLEREIISNTKQFQDECYAIQVKEKYGSLRFYMTMETDEMKALIEQTIDKIYEYERKKTLQQNP